MAEIMSTAAVGATGDNSDPNLSMDLVNTMQALFKEKRKGYRTTHAKGILVDGKFTPTKEAKTLSSAAHFNNASTSVLARFSVGGGIPDTRDANDGATPKGIAIRFQVDSDVHTDLIAHSFNGFATRTGEEFLELLTLVNKKIAAGGALQAAKPTDPDFAAKKKAYDDVNAAIGAFVGRVPTAGVFLDGARPNPHTYGTITYYEPNTHVLTNREGKVTNVRYRLIPADGDHLYTDKAEIAALPRDYLEDDLKQRFPGKPVVFTIEAHVAAPDDVLDNATIPYKSTTFIPIGKLELNKVSDDNRARQQQIAFSPMPSRGGIKGITESKDPLIQARKGVYYISADQRRHAKQEE